MLCLSVSVSAIEPVKLTLQEVTSLWLILGLWSSDEDLCFTKFLLKDLNYIEWSETIHY